MSRPLRVGLVTEGPTDRVVLECLLPHILGREVVCTPLFPQQESLAFGGGLDGFGWRGVLGWCKSTSRPDGIGLQTLVTNLDLLVVHLDGDVSREPDVALAMPCPPAQDTTNRLRALLLQEMGLSATPPFLVLMTPMDATEAWLVPALRSINWAECAPDPAAQFKGGKPKLLEASGKKLRRRYEEAGPHLRKGWSSSLTLSEATRFQQEVQDAVQALGV